MQKRIVINFSLPPAPGSLDYQMEKLLKCCYYDTEVDF